MPVKATLTFNLDPIDGFESAADYENLMFALRVADFKSTVDEISKLCSQRLKERVSKGEQNTIEQILYLIREANLP